MDENHAMDTSNKSNGDEKKRPFSPTKYITEIGRLRSDKLIKAAELEARKVCFKSFKAVHDEVARENPTINLNFQRFENYQLAKTSKCQEEIKAIDMEMQKIREQARESRQNN